MSGPEPSRGSGSASISCRRVSGIASHRRAIPTVLNSSSRTREHATTVNGLHLSATGSIAPKQSPTTSGRSRRPSRHSSTRPSAITKNVSVSSPSRTICAFSGTSTSTTVPASARTSRGFSGVNTRIASACVPNPTCPPAPSSARCSLRPIPRAPGPRNRPPVAAVTTPPTTSVLASAPVPSSLMLVLSSPAPGSLRPSRCCPVTPALQEGWRGGNGRSCGSRGCRWFWGGGMWRKRLSGGRGLGCPRWAPATSRPHAAPRRRRPAPES